METDTRITQRFKSLEPFLDEHLRRLAAAAETRGLEGRSISRVSRATGVSRRAIRQGLSELVQPPVLPPTARRIRKPGGGRKRATAVDLTLQGDLDRLIEPGTRGDPESPLRWTCKSVRRLAEELRKQGHKTSHRMVAELLHELNYSLQANSKTLEGGDHPDRNSQFEHIHQAAQRRLLSAQPVISVDTKKKELVGDFRNGGRELRPKGRPEKVRVHDFVLPDLGRANPYGVYGLAHNTGWVSVGIDHDTAAFAVESIRRWWNVMGCPLYPGATRLLIVADGGGSNGSRVRLWKLELQKLADESGLVVDVCHLPPGTSKWNKIEHRLFSFITQNWRGGPLVSHEVIVSLIAATTNRKGLKVRCALDTNAYAPGIKVSEDELATVNIVRDPFHGEWNYSIHPHAKMIQLICDRP